MFDVRVSRRHTALSLCFTNGAVQMNLILPVRVRPRAEIVARTRIAWYEASAARQRAVTKGPGSDTPGGATIRPPWCANLRTLVKRRGVYIHPLSPVRRLPEKDHGGVW